MVRAADSYCRSCHAARDFADRRSRFLVLRHLQSTIPRQRASQRSGKFTNMPTQGRNDNRRVSASTICPGLSVFTGMARSAHAPLRPQVVHQLFFQYSPCLNEQAAVHGLVGHAHALIVGIAGLQPSGNLLGRPVQNQFTRNDVAPWRATSRLTVDAARSRRLAISRIDKPEAIPREIFSRSASVSATRERRRSTGGMPPRGSNTARIELCGLPALP